MKKKLALLLISIITIASFAACTDRSAVEESSQDESQSESSGTGVVTEHVDAVRPSLQEAAENNAKMDGDLITLVQLAEPQIGDPTALIQTTQGNIRILLYPEYAPQAVENFTTLAEDGFYNGKLFHFAQENFMIQSGAVNSNGTGSRSIYENAQGDQEYYDNELSWDLWHFNGAVSLVHTSEGKNGSQFVIVASDDIYGHELDDLEAASFPQRVIDAYQSRGGIPYRDGVNTVFAMVIEGFDVVDAISYTETDASGMPLEPVLIESVTVEPYSGQTAEAEGEDDQS